MIRIFLSAGESSSDTHAGNLISAMRKIDPAVKCEGLGGQHMAEAGMDLRCDLAGRAVMGFYEVVRSIPFMRRLFHESVEHIRQTRPDAVVLVDYPDFNMRLARKCKDMGVPVVYYISPQVWAWRKGRVHTLARIVDKMLVIFPFEKEIYDEVQLDCTFVGHPLIDHIRSVPISGTYYEDPAVPVVGILAGSRAQEIRRILPIMLDVARGIRKIHPDIRFIAPCVDAECEDQARAIAGDFPMEFVVGKNYEVLHAARFCLVKSGTSTVETTLFKVPFVIVYVTSAVSYFLARLVVNIDVIGMVNILAGKKIVPEFIQSDARAENILPVALELLEDSDARKTMLEELGRVADAVGGGGASEAAAREVLAVVERKASA